MLARVGNDHMGRFLTETLRTRRLRREPRAQSIRERLTALVLLGLKDRDTFPLMFYRENCADMAVDEADFDEAFIASSNALLITGTHFSTEQVNRTSRRALDYARRNQVRTVLDIDYRPVLWGLTGQGGRRDALRRERRRHRAFAAHPAAVRSRDRHRGGVSHRRRQDRPDRRARDGARGHARPRWSSSAGRSAARSSTARCPPRSTTRRFTAACEVEVLNVLGAGDAFASGFLSGWLRDRAARSLRARRQRVRRARRLAPRLRAGDADARRTRLLPARSEGRSRSACAAPIATRRSRACIA